MAEAPSEHEDGRLGMRHYYQEADPARSVPPPHPPCPYLSGWITF